MERNPWWRGNLPAETSGFIGRETESRELPKLLAGTSLAAVTDGGGVGRSRIAVKAAEEWAARLNFSITDIRLALDSGDPAVPLSVELAGMLRILRSCLGRSSEGRHYMGRSIDAAPVTDPGLPRLLRADGCAAVTQGDLGSGRRRAEAALSAALDRGDHEAPGHARRRPARRSPAVGPHHEVVPGLEPVREYLHTRRGASVDQPRA
ncbi:hypothetical protein ABT003_22090, partial [Streptosporangium roseum]